jgi:phosphoglycerate dehydrogenase-like enzyme
MKAVLHYRATAGLRRQIAATENEWLRIVTVDVDDASTFAEEIADAEVLLHVLEPVGGATIDRAPRLRLIQKLGVGVDTIDLDLARQRGIAVCNMPGTNTRAVAELTLLLMLATLRRLTDLDHLVRAGQGWAVADETIDGLGELGGRTVGLVGFGAVGRCLAPMLTAVGATVTYTDVREAAGAPARFLTFDDLLSSADIVSLHVPLTADTAGMMNAAAFSKMKAGSILINAARGRLVDEPALLDVLRRGHLRGAGLDVFNTEPVETSNPLLRCPNVIATPHLAWLTAETIGRSLAVFAENCRRLRHGQELLHRVV